MDISTIFVLIIALALGYSIIRIFIGFVKNLISLIYGFAKCRTPVTATVAGRHEHTVHTDDGSEEEYSYCYQFNLNGIDYTVHSKTWSFVPYRVGSTVTLYVDETNPNIIFERGMILVNSIVNLIVFLVMIGACIFTLHEMQPVIQSVF